MKLTRVVLLIFGVAVAFWNSTQAWAQGSVAPENVRAEYTFGGQVTFFATIKASIPIQNISLIILDDGRGLTHIQPVALNPDGTSQTIFDARQNQLRPFATIRWRYEFTFSDGTTQPSDMFSFRYTDNRFAWQSVESNNLRIMWLNGDAAFSQTALDAALAGVRNVNEFFPADLSQPIEIFIYPSQNDLAFLGTETWAAGHADPALGVALLAIEPGLEQSQTMERNIPHELMHILLYRQLGAGYNNVPAWLREGLATQVEINPTPDYDIILQDASANNGLIPLRDLCASFPADSASAFLAYAQARSFTTYLRETYGSPTLLQLAEQYATGVTCERGVEFTYNTSLAQLELRWREAALGENAWAVALRRMTPVLVLLCLVFVIPLWIGWNIRKKAPQR